MATNHETSNSIESKYFLKSTKKRIICLFLCALIPYIFGGCSIIRLTGDTVEMSGKVFSTAVKSSALVVRTTANITGTTVGYFSGKKVVKLDRKGNSFLVSARINGRHKSVLVLDTGATDVQLSSSFAREIGIDLSKSRTVRITLADGSVKSGHAITLDEIKIGKVKVKHVEAIILDTEGDQETHGLLGMSFLQNFNFKIDTDKNVLILRYKDE